MKLLALITAFVTAGWLIAVAAYTLYEVTMLQKGYDVTFTNFEFREGLLNALNYALPVTVLCVFFVIKTNGTDPVSTEVFLLCMVTCVLAAYLGYRASEAAFPDPLDTTFAKKVWWVPNPPESLADDF